MRDLSSISLTVVMMSVLVVSGCLSSDDAFDTADQFALDVQQIDQYLAERGIIAERDPGTEIRYVVHNEGTGLELIFIPDSLTLSYEGRLLETEEQFVSVTSKKENTRTIINNGISGIITAVSKVREGGFVTAYIPSFYGYGSRQVGDVPPNSVLIMDITFEQLNHRQLLQDIQLIDAALEVNQIEAVEHPAGIRYVQNEIGTGNFPNFNSMVRVTYKERLLGETESLEEKTNQSYSLSDFVLGVALMLTEMKPGELRVVYIPSSYGYGVNGSQDKDVPANAILEYDIELLSVN